MFSTSTTFQHPSMNAGSLFQMQSSPFQEFNHANHRKREWDVTPPSSFPFPHHQSIMPPLPPIMNPNEPHWQLQQQMAQQLEENNFSHKRCRFEEPSSPFYNTAVPSNSSSLCFHQSNPPTTPSVMNHLPSTPSNSVGGTPFFPSSSYGVGVPSCGQHSPIMTHQPEQMNVGNRPASKLAQSWFTNNMTGGNQQKSSKTVSFAPEPPRQCWFCRATNGNPPGTNVMIASAKIISCSQCSKDCCQSRCIISCDNCSSVCCTGCMMVDYSNTFERKLCYECYYVSQ